MTTGRRLSLTTLGLGLTVIVLAQLAGPRVAPPLYDGVIPTQPYRWLQPPPGQPGGAQGITATVAVSGGQSELVAVATEEVPPQAQIFAQPGGITLAPGASTLHVSIQPIPTPAPPPSGYIDGNVYRLSVTDQAGAELSAPAGAQATILLRSAQQTLTTGTIERFDGTAWQPIATSLSGPGQFLAVVTTFGDFAVVAQGQSPYPTVAASATPSASSQAVASASPASAGSAVPTSSPSSSGTARPEPNPGSGGGISPWIFLGAAVAVFVVLVASAVVRPGRRPRRRGWE